MMHWKLAFVNRLACQMICLHIVFCQNERLVHVGCQCEECQEANFQPAQLEVDVLESGQSPGP